MRKLILMLMVILSFSISQATYHGIVNNSGSTAADSISIPFWAEDSTGNMVAMASGDSVFINVYYPSGALAYRDSLAYNGTKITAQATSDYTSYTWKEAVATIVGTPKNGTYSYVLYPNDQTGAALATPFRGSFTLYTTDDFNTHMDSVTNAITNSNKANFKATGFSTLTTSDNIGINWGDVTNQTTEVTLSSTTIGLATDITNTVTFDNTSIATVTDVTNDVTFDNTTIGTVTGNVDGSVASVTGKVTLVDSSAAGISQNRDSLESQDDWVAHESTVENIQLTGTNIATVAGSRTLTDGTETNTYAATQVHDGTYYQVAEGGTGTNLNINYYLEFDIGADTKPVHTTYHGRLDEGSAPSGQDVIDVYAYDWDGAIWTHVSPPDGDIVGVNGSSSADDQTYQATLVDPNFVGMTGGDIGKVRIAFSNYDPDDAAASDLKENTELYLDYVFLEYQSLLSVDDIWEYATANITSATGIGKTIIDSLWSNFAWDSAVRAITGDTYTPDVNLISINADVILATHFAQAYWTAYRDSIGEFWAETDTTGLRTVAGSYGEILANPTYVQGSAGDAWATALPGAYGIGTAGYIVGTYLDSSLTAIRDSIMATIAARSAIGDTLQRNASTLTDTQLRDAVGDTVLNRTAIGDTAQVNSAVAGDAMTLTAGERAAIEDTIANHASTYQSDGDTNQVNIPSILDYWNIAFATGFTAGSMGDSLTNKTYVQGAAGSVTDESIRDAVWSKDTTNTDTIGVLKWMEDNLATADVSGCTGGGTGIYACTLWVVSTVDNTGILNCFVQAKVDGGETSLGTGNTLGNGFYVFSQNAVDLNYYAGALPGYTFTSPIDVTISGNQTDSIWGTPVPGTTPSTIYHVVLKFYQLSPSFDSLSATRVDYRLVHKVITDDGVEATNDTTYQPYGTNDDVTYGTAGSTAHLGKKFQTEPAGSDSSYVTFDVVNNWDIYVNGVADTSSYYEFLIRWKDRIETRIVEQIDTTSVQSPGSN